MWKVADSVVTGYEMGRTAVSFPVRGKIPDLLSGPPSSPI
jgi:hypothetical protein